MDERLGDNSKCQELSEVSSSPTKIRVSYWAEWLIIPGVLVECDPSIKSIIVKIDSEDHAFIVEELDDQTLVIKENMLSVLKMRLEDVSSGLG